MKPGEYVAHLETKGKSREEPGKRLDAPTLLVVVEMEQNTDIAKYLRASCKKYLRKLLRQLELRYTPQDLLQNIKEFEEDISTQNYRATRRLREYIHEIKTKPPHKDFKVARDAIRARYTPIIAELRRSQKQIQMGDWMAGTDTLREVFPLFWPIANWRKEVRLRGVTIHAREGRRHLEGDLKYELLIKKTDN